MIREKPHRLGPEAYVGEVLVAFTACVEERRSLFVQDTVVLPFIEMLTETLERFVCSAPVYCFMPDHLHVIVQGRSASSDTRAVMSAFKQKSGFWLASPHQAELAKGFLGSRDPPSRRLGRAGAIHH